MHRRCRHCGCHLQRTELLVSTCVSWCSSQRPRQGLPSVVEPPTMSTVPSGMVAREGYCTHARRLQRVEACKACKACSSCCWQRGSARPAALLALTHLAPEYGSATQAPLSLRWEAQPGRGAWQAVERWRTHIAGEVWPHAAGPTGSARLLAVAELHDAARAAPHRAHTVVGLGACGDDA